MNVVVLYGRMVRDPEIRLGGAEKKSVGRFTIAVPRNKEETDFFNCIAFGKNAEVAEKYLSKGNRVAVRGRLRMESYEKDGEKKSFIDIVIDAIDLVETKSEKYNKDDDLPFN